MLTDIVDGLACTNY